MSLFLFLKQFVDMLYQYKWLDYFMVFYAVGLMIWKIYHNLKANDIKYYTNKVCFMDACVFGMSISFFISFLHNMGGLSSFIKAESALFIYFIGRLCYKEIINGRYILAIAGYLIIYLNFFYRLYHYHFKLFDSEIYARHNSSGEFYYYKTDMAIGIMIALLFVYLYGRNKYIKYATILLICPYMIFYSGARMGQVMLIIEYLCLLFFHFGKHKKDYSNKRTWQYTIIFGIFSILILGFIQLIPFAQIADALNMETGAGSLLENIMHSRHVIWWEVIDYFTQQSFLTRMFGIDFITERFHNARGMRAHSLFVQQIYATGYLGCILLSVIIGRVVDSLKKNRNSILYREVLVLGIIFLGVGISTESFIFTQISWFPFLFLGAFMSETHNKRLL